ncbi:MAG: type IV pilus secretin PilQ [Candidatus Krumholzibacteria bacterium]|nr:type IV pilus secretin PilQ [Candidatus Krumholzibacteria bacterium]
MLGISRRTLIACSVLVLSLLALSAGAVENEINGVNVVPADGKVRIEISKAGSVTFDAFTMSEPDRLVINCVGAKYNVPWQSKDIQSPIVKKVRTSQFELDPLVISRVVLDLSAGIDYRMWAEGEKQIVEVTSRAPEALHAEVKESAVLMQPLAETSAAEEKAPAAKAETGAKQLVASASMGPFLPYIPNLNAIAVEKPAVSKARAPVEASNVAPVAQSVSTADAPAQQTSAAQSISTVDMPVQQPPAVAKAAVEEAAAEKTESPWVSGDDAQESDASEKTNFYAMNDDAYSPLAETEAAKPATTTWADNYARGNPAVGSGRAMGSNRITVDAQGADIKTVLRTISDYSGKNIVYGPDVKGEVFIHIKDVPREEALDIILNAHGYGYLEEYGMIRVSEIERLTKEELDLQSADRKKDDLLPLITKIIFVNNSNAEELKTALQDLSSTRGKIDFDKGSNSLIVSDTEPVIEKIEETVTTLDRKTYQVDINAKLVDVDVEATRELGIDWSALNLHASGFGGVGSVAVTNEIATSAATAKFGTVRSWGELNAVLQMLEKTNKANIISNPRITTMDNREARILVGKEIPLIVSDEAGNAVTELTKVGIMLKVTPHVNSDRTITLDMHPEVSDLQSEATVQGGVIISTNEADTRVVVKNGDTAVIGGLIKNSQTSMRQGVPVLKDVPFLGWLFSTSSKVSKKQELVIFVTPTIVE